MLADDDCSGGSTWDEAERSAALHSFDVLDTPRESDFDEIVKMAARVLGSPIAVVNLVDTTRQFFKAEIGLGVRSTPLETAFCRHALLEEDILVIPDATKDHRLAANPLVTGAPHIRSYAGALMKTESGLPIGTVCILDYAVRSFTDEQIDMLRFLARQAMTQLELRRTVAAKSALLARAKAAERRQAHFERVVRQASDFIAIADHEGRVRFLNDAARSLIGLTDARSLPTAVMRYIAKADRQAFRAHVLPLVRAGESCTREIRLRHVETGEDVPALHTMFSMRGEDGGVIGYGVVTKDLAEQKAEEARRKAIMVEAAHRIKNTLSVVTAIVSQSLRAADSLTGACDAITMRVAALARAQDILTAAEGDVADLAEVIERALAPHDGGLGRIVITGPAWRLAARQALGLSLALHELATNAVKYGALSNDRGIVDIRWTVDDAGVFQFDWRESGGPPVSPPSRTGFGSQLIRRMVAPYFNGEAALDYHPEGVTFRLRGRINDEE
jgi:PAS domain S-box-containing protein